MSLWGDSLGKFSTTDRYARLLVQGVPISGRRERNGQRLLPYRDGHRYRQDHRLSKCRGQWQPDAPAILPNLRDAAYQ